MVAPMQGLIDASQGAWLGSLMSQPGLTGQGTASQMFQGQGGQVGRQPGTYFTGQPGQQLQGLQQQGSFFEGGPQQQSLDFLMSGDVMHADANPYLQSFMQAASRPLMQQFNEQILPTLGDAASQTGQFGGSRHGVAQGIATRGLGDTLGDMYANMAQSGYTQGLGAMMQGLGMGQGAHEQALGRQMQGLGLGMQGHEAAAGRQLGADQTNAQMQAHRWSAQNQAQAQQNQMLQNLLGMAPTQAALGLMPAQAMGQLGGQRQDQVQASIDDAMQRWGYAQQAPGDSLAQYANLISGTIPGAAGTATTSQQGVGGLQGALGGALGGLQMGSDLAGLIGSIFGK